MVSKIEEMNEQGFDGPIIDGQNVIETKAEKDSIGAFTIKYEMRKRLIV